jgi:hypothetical protein
VEPVNTQMEQFSMERIQPIQLKSEGTRKETLKEKINAIQKFIQGDPSLII